MNKRDMLKHLLSRTVKVGACRLFIGPTDKSGHPRVWDPRNKCMIGGHRLSYELAKGPIPEGEVILHSCNNPACMAPRHLSAGTQAENMAQKFEENRSNVTKLTPRKVKNIVKHLDNGGTCAYLGRKYGVTAAAISNIKSGQSWAHIPRS